MAEPTPPQPGPTTRAERKGAARLLGPAGRLAPVNYVELFVVANLAFLALDIFIAHSINGFGAHALHRYARWAEWVPIVFSPAAALLLTIGLTADRLSPARAASWWLGVLVGCCSMAVGIAGLLFHLESQFFELRTLKSLVYTAPFAAPLAYTGLGLLLILDRTVDPDSVEWAGWVVLLAMGGFLGNFILSLADHAQNGFGQWAEWIPVVAAAFAVGFLSMPLLMQTGGDYVKWCAAVIALNAAVGLAGFALHVAADLRGPASSIRENFLYGAPVFAPLLFPNLSMLAALGLWALERSRTVDLASAHVEPA